MSYPGNSSLAAEIQERILTTFEQTLDLASRGELPEATIGCDFILRLDPLFQPAAQLKERLTQGDGPVLVDDLRLADRPAPEPTTSGDVFELANRDEPAAPVEEVPTVETPAAADPPAEEASEGQPAEPTDEASGGVFSDVQAQELEAALDWSALSEPAAEPEPAPESEPAQTRPRLKLPDMARPSLPRDKVIPKPGPAAEEP